MPMDRERHLVNNFKNTLSLHAGLSTTWNITLSETTRFSDASKSLRGYRGVGLTIRLRKLKLALYRPVSRRTIAAAKPVAQSTPMPAMTKVCRLVFTLGGGTSG